LVDNAMLTIEQIAKRQAISPGYVQMLFEETGTTFSEFALGCRLDVAQRMWNSPRFASWSVLAIALEAGFSDLSHFHRRFKRRYLMTPSDMRNLSRV